MAPPHHARTEIGDVKEADVLKGRGLINHPGNVYFRQLITEHCARYQECSSRGDCRDEMNGIVQGIIDKVRAAGGRFIDKNYKGWVELAQKEQREKVVRSLKDAKTVDSSSSTRDHQGGRDYVRTIEQVQPTSRPGSIYTDQHSKPQASFPSVPRGILPQFTAVTTYFGNNHSVQSLQQMPQPFVAPQTEPLYFTSNMGMQTPAPSTNGMPNASTAYRDCNYIVERAGQLPESLNAPLQTGHSTIGLGTAMEIPPYRVDPRQTNVGTDVPVSVSDQKIAPVSIAAPTSKKSLTPSASGQLHCGPKETEKDETDSKWQSLANGPAEDWNKCAAICRTRGPPSQEHPTARATPSDSSYMNAAATTGELEYSCSSLSLGSGSIIQGVRRDCGVHRHAGVPDGSLLSGMDISGTSLDMMASLNMSSMNMSLDFGGVVVAAGGAGEPPPEPLERADSNRTLPVSNRRRSAATNNNNDDSSLSDLIATMLQEDLVVMPEEKQVGGGGDDDDDNDPPATRAPQPQQKQQQQQATPNSLLRPTCRRGASVPTGPNTGCPSSSVASMHSSVSTEGSLVDSK